MFLNGKIKQWLKFKSKDNRKLIYAKSATLLKKIISNIIFTIRRLKYKKGRINFMNTTVVGKNILELRKAKGITQETLATEVGVQLKLYQNGKQEERLI